MHPKETCEDSSVVTLEYFIGEKDSDAARYLNNPENPLWVTDMEMSDTDGAKLAIVRSDPHFWAPCHILRVEDGEYAHFAPWQIVGDVFEREIGGEVYLCIDQWPDGIVIVDPNTLEVKKWTLSMLWKLELAFEKKSISERMRNILKR